MTDFIEMDFIEAGDRGSGDAIAIRRRSNGVDRIYVVDGGYADDGRKIIDHIHMNYGADHRVNHVVLTHSDADHASGLTTVLDEAPVDCLWMNRPWRHVDALMPLFKWFQDRDRLVTRLRSAFPKVAELEGIADARGIPIRDAFRGHQIGDFRVLSPDLATYLHLVAESDKTPVTVPGLATLLGEPVFQAAWGVERLKGDTEGTSPDNETSVVLFADACNTKVLLTGDAGVRALTEAHLAAHQMGIWTAPIDWFQVPHHGSRRNLSSHVLDLWLGAKQPPAMAPATLWAVVSANRNDRNHPKKAVIRALVHRGRSVFQTDGTLCMRSAGAPDRGWQNAQPLAYPQDQEG